ncbi:MAG: hypothetical protein HGB26_08185 [Desulfobulbaceae bacterium]|nr:hypothetical protein [Desulfobulbaceae bacterium]
MTPEFVTTPELVTIALENFSVFLMKYLTALAAVGALTMALIEAYKKVFDSRTMFQFNYIRGFIDDDQEAQKTSREITEKLNLNYTFSDTFSELVHLMSGIEVAKARLIKDRDDEKLLTVFSLEVANMMGKIQDAVDAAIDNPIRYPNLFIFATSGADTGDAAAWMELSHISSVNTDPAMAKTRSELYTRLHQLAKRKLDRLQLQLTYRWANLNQLYANGVGSVILLIALLWICRNVAMHAGDVLLIVLASTIGGILSPVAKDMISWLQKVKSSV